MNCPNCDRTNPADAKFCIYCATNLAPTTGEAASVVTTPVTGPTKRLDPMPEASYTMPQTQPASTPASAPVHTQGKRSFNKDAITAAWLIGIGVLLLTGDFFPGILVLVGVTSYMRDTMRGRQDKALGNLIFFTGLALLFWSNFFFPGILFLLGAMWLLNSRGYRFGCN